MSAALPPCPCCDGTAGIAWRSGHDRLTGLPGVYTFVACTTCGLRRLHPLPDASSVLYPAAYEFFRLHEEPLQSPLRRLARWHSMLRRRQLVCHLSGRQRGALLDVGCATGAFLALMQTHGWQVQGVEPSPAAATIARQRGLQIHNSGLEEAVLTPNQFDVITLWDVLEHIPDPLATLQAARQALKPGGVVLLRVPSPAGLDARLFGTYWTGLDFPRHCWLFTWPQVRTLCQRAGFATVTRHWVYSPYVLWRYSAEFWLDDHLPRALQPWIRPLLRSPLLQAATWPCFRAIQQTEWNSMLFVVAQRAASPSNNDELSIVN